MASFPLGLPNAGSLIARNADFAAEAVSPTDAQARAAYAKNYAANPTVELPPDKFRVLGGLLFAGVNGQPRELWTRD